MNDCKKCDNSLKSIHLNDVSKLLVRGKEVGMNALDEIMDEVKAMGLPEANIADAPLKMWRQMTMSPLPWPRNTGLHCCRNFRGASAEITDIEMKHGTDEVIL
ncbi:MAG: hypothetical protein MIO90_03570 [Methanomassiliicoccales archaeon]|nr:hypothetical protein [Methanomassiliicoccales archaeon]